jgi:hypothetical protein
MVQPHQTNKMINYLLLLGALIQLNCTGPSSAQMENSAHQNPTSMKADTNRLYSDVKYLTELQPARNSDHPASLNQAAAYIEKQFQQTGLKTETQTWKVGNVEYRNVIASYNPSGKERLVIGAHYDVNGDQPGADDNASSVAGLLETARLIMESNPNLAYRIDFVAYSLEEPPHFTLETMGSYVHAKSLKDAGTPVLGMLCYEIIGYFSDQPGSQHFPSPTLAAAYPSTGNFIVVVGLQAQRSFSRKVFDQMKQQDAVDVQHISFPSSAGLAGLSDHRNYWAFGFPAVMINDTAFLRNLNYHKKSDTMETLNFEKMAAVVDATYKAAVAIR